MQNDVFDHEDNTYAYCGCAGCHTFSVSVTLGDEDLDAVNVSVEIWPAPRFWARLKEAWSILMGHHTMLTFHISHDVAEKIETEIKGRLNVKEADSNQPD